MLEQLTITGGACFGSTPLVLKPLQRVNFFFGPNGSGKTTISRALDGSQEATAGFVWHDSAPLAIKVYNRDFVSRVLRESTRIPGVFVIGDKSAEAETRLGQIEGAQESGLGRSMRSGGRTTAWGKLRRLTQMPRLHFYRRHGTPTRSSPMQTLRSSRPLREPVVSGTLGRHL